MNAAMERFCKSNILQCNNKSILFCSKITRDVLYYRGAMAPSAITYLSLVQEIDNREKDCRIFDSMTFAV